MPDPRPQRKKSVPLRFRHSEANKSVVSEKVARGRPRESRSRGPRRPPRDEPRSLGASVTGAPQITSQSESNTESQVNDSVENISDQNAPIEGAETPISDISEMGTSVASIQATLSSTRDEVVNFLHVTTRTLAALFSVLTKPQLDELVVFN